MSEKFNPESIFGKPKEGPPTDEELESIAMSKIKMRNEPGGIIFGGYMNDLKDLSKGNDFGDLKKHYPGWNPEDFKKLVDTIEQKLDQG